MLSSVSLLNTICFGVFFFSIYTVYTDLMPEMMYNKTKFCFMDGTSKSEAPHEE